MILIGIDVGKDSHTFSIVSKDSGVILVEPTEFSNTKSGFSTLYNHFIPYDKDELLIGMEDTGHYHFNLLKDLLDQHFTVALINPVVTDLTRKMQGGVSKNDKLDSLTICDVLASSARKKSYRITKLNRFDLYEQRQLTRHHHNLKEELNVYTNRLQKCIDVVFPEYNHLFKSKYGSVYMQLLKNFSSADKIANAELSELEPFFENQRGRRISLTPQLLQQTAQNSVGIPSCAEEIQIKHLIAQIELIQAQIAEIDKKIEEFSLQMNSPILTIPGVSHFSGTSILAELGEICNYSSAAKIIKFAGLAPYEYQSSQFKAEHMPISKKGSKYLRKTLYQVILPVIRFNPVFQDYYRLKRSQGKGHRCAQGHCIRKLLRVIYHLLSTQQSFDPLLLK
mgnify:CR=1 FL=1